MDEGREAELHSRARSPSDGRRPSRVAAAPERRAASLSRRTFLGGALSLPAAAWLAGCVGRNGELEGEAVYRGEGVAVAPPPGGGLERWSDVRALFDLDPDVKHLSAYILAPHPRPVREAIDRHRRGLDRDPRRYFYAQEGEAEGRAAEAAADYLGTTSDLIALTDSTSMGLGLLVGGLRLAQGDEIVTTAHDHYAAHESIRHAAQRAGAGVRKVELYPPEAPERASVAGILSAVKGALSRSTRLVLVTWVHSSSGIRLPVREISDVVARANEGRPEAERALLFVDGAHGLGTGPVSVDDLECDALIAGCHKWLLGPRGTGVAWAREQTWQRMTPIIPSFDGRLYGAWMGGDVGTAPPGPTFTPGGFHSFEHRWALPEAFDLHRRIGSSRIEARIEELSGRLRAGLAGASKVRLHVPAEERLRSGVVCFTVDGVSAGEVVQRTFADRRVNATVTPYAVSFARLGTCWLNDEDEVDAAVEAVRRLS